MRITIAALCVGLAIAVAAPRGAVLAQSGPIRLVPHRAIYDLKLGQTRGNSQIASVRGRIVYDFDGNACEGYSLNFRQVSELDTGEGKIVTSDLRSVTWEAGDFKNFKFTSQNYIDQNLVDSVEGAARRGAAATVVSLTKPSSKSIDIDAGIVFPTEHMVRAIEAGRAGKTILELPVFDGTETGEKIYSTLTVIGPQIAPDQRKPNDAAADRADLAGQIRWPVNVSYFEQGKKGKSGEQTPVYSIGFELYEDGISRALTLDYNDFVITGAMTSLDIKPVKPCR